MTVDPKRRRTVTVSPREQSPSVRGRQTQTAIDAAARAVIARKGFLATTVSDVTVEAGKSATSLYSKESMVRAGYCEGDDPKLTAVALVSMLNRFCDHQFSGDGRADAVDDAACITTVANAFYRTIYHKETGPT